MPTVAEAAQDAGAPADYLRHVIRERHPLVKHNTEVLGYWSARNGGAHGLDFHGW